MEPVGALLAALSVVLVLAAWWRWAQSQEAIRRCGERIPGPRALPIVGNILDVGLNTKEYVKRGQNFIKIYGFTMRFWVGSYLFVAVSDAQDVETILNSSKNLSKSFNYKFLHSWLGEGLLTSTGDRWRKHRKIITPTFHFKILEEFNSVFNAQGDTLVGILRQKVGKGFFDVTPLINAYTQDVICDTAMGIQVHAQTDGNSSEYLRAVKDQCEILTSRATQPWLYSDFIFNLTPMGRRQARNLKIMHAFTDKVISMKKKNFLAANSQSRKSTLAKDEMGIKRRLAFLDYLLLSSENGTVLTDEDIREEVETFMFEGHDTTSSAISFAIFELSKQPKLQDELFRELVQVCGDRPDNSRFSTEIFGELKLLERVVKETLRVFPSVPAIGRHIEYPVYLPSVDTEIPPGVTVVISPLMMHHNPKIFPDPSEFNPDHFLPEKVEQRHHFAYLPFSAGSRNCIGQKFAMLELKSVLSKIIWNFTMELEEGFVPELVAEITMKSWNGIRISVSRRER